MKNKKLKKCEEFFEETFESEPTHADADVWNDYSLIDFAIQYSEYLHEQANNLSHKELEAVESEQQKERIVNSIEMRIMAEALKHKDSNWARISAHKIYSEHFANNQNS